jgi:glycerophosphoryl diester phosphodiesterase
MTNLHFIPPVIAHRGASAIAPENTLAAFRLAHEAGALWVECDVKLTRDGAPIIMHDDTLDRTTDGKGNVADMDWADVQKLDAGVWFDARFRGERVPQLAEALRFILDHDMRLNLEIKPCPGRAQATAMVALIETAKLWPPYYAPPVISSFNEKALAIAAQLHPHWPRSFAFEGWNSDWRASAARVGAEALTVNAEILTSDRMHVLAQTGLAVLAYTSDDPLRAKQLLNEGAMIEAL